MPARGAFAYHVHATAAKPPRLVALLRAPVASPEKAVEAWSAIAAKGLAAARARGQTAHELYVRMGAPGEPAELLGLDTWATVEGLVEHYGSAESMEGLRALFSGAPAASVWEQATGFNEW
jgi:hypothetical protein